MVGCILRWGEDKMVRTRRTGSEGSRSPQPLVQPQQQQLSFDKDAFMQQLKGVVENVVEERFKKFEEDSQKRSVKGKTPMENDENHHSVGNSKKMHDTTDEGHSDYIPHQPIVPAPRSMSSAVYYTQLTLTPY